MICCLIDGSCTVPLLGSANLLRFVNKADLKAIQRVSVWDTSGLVHRTDKGVASPGVAMTLSRDQYGATGIEYALTPSL